MKISNILKAFIALALVALIGCSEKEGVIDNSSSSLDKSGDYYVLGIEDGMASIEDATLDKDMGFKPDFEGKDFFFDKRHERKSKFKGKGLKLGLVFYKLNLTDNQKESIKTFFEDNRACVSVPFENFRVAAKAIMEKRKADIKAVRDLVKAGELTRTEARAEIRKINEATKEEIKNNDVCIQAKEDICACNKTLLENIASILDENQLTIWNEWLSNMPRPCIGG